MREGGMAWQQHVISLLHPTLHPSSACSKVELFQRGIDNYKALRRVIYRLGAPFAARKASIVTGDIVRLVEFNAGA